MTARRIDIQTTSSHMTVHTHAERRGDAQVQGQLVAAAARAALEGRAEVSSLAKQEPDGTWRVLVVVTASAPEGTWAWAHHDAGKMARDLGHPVLTTWDWR